ncbi:MAG: PAS domain-containing protein, partial [bacterium]|nr:PAS domain-containing protein [bacterium]
MHTALLSQFLMRTSGDIEQNSLYMLLLLTAAVISASIAVTAWKRRQIGPNASVIALFMAAAAWWALAYAIHWSGLFRLYTHFWLNATYLGIAVVPTAYFVFALHFTGHGSWLTRRKKFYLAVEPVLTLLFLWTDKLHGLFFAGHQREGTSSILEGGVWFWVNITYSYILILIAFVVLLLFLRKAGTLRRKQIILVLAGALIPWVSSAVGLADAGPVSDLDLTAFAFTLTGAAFAYALFRLNLLNIVPVARDALVEIMTDGFFVVDLENHVVDINLAAQELLGIPKASIGEDAEYLFRHTPDLVELYKNVKEGEFEFFTEYYGNRHLHMQVVPL